MATGVVKWFNVYFIFRVASGKGYVGWTSRTPEDRFSRHCQLAYRGSESHFHRAIRKYGKGAWDIKVLANAKSAEEAKQLERKFIAELGTVDWGYNLTNGGDGLSDPTGEISRKISATLKGRGLGVPKSEETKQRMRKPKSLEHRIHSGLAQRGRKFTAEHKLKLRLAKLGKKVGPASPERREKIRQSISNWWKMRRTGNGNRDRQMVFG